MSNMNPLSKFTKIEKVYIRLPTNSQVKYDDSVLKNSTIECGVAARSARDELMFNNPEALMNGQAVVKVIENCVPNVVDANKLYTPDVEALLIAIKSATDEDSYDIETKCPNCDHYGAFERNLSYLLNTMTYLKEAPSVALDSGLVVYLQPITWEVQSNMSVEMYQLQQKMKVLDSDMPDEERVKIGVEVFDQMAEFQFNSVLHSIDYIEVPSEDDEDSKVTDKDFINEWLREQPKAVLSSLIEKSNEVNAIGISHEMDVECSECNHQWTIDGLRFNPTNFFTRDFSHQNQKK